MPSVANVVSVSVVERDQAMSETRKFPIDAVLSVTTGMLLTELGDVYKVIDFLSGQVHMTHQLPAAQRRLTPVIYAQFPRINGVEPPLIPKDKTKTAPDDEWVVDRHRYGLWLREVKQVHGATLELTPLPEGGYERMMGEDR